MKVRKAIIPAAGMGTRVLPASKAIPKEMLNIVDKPAIQYIVEEAFNSGIEEVLIITNRGKGAIEDHFDHAYELESKLKDNEGKKDIYNDVLACSKFGNIFFIRQKETKGLGHLKLLAIIVSMIFKIMAIGCKEISHTDKLLVITYHLLKIRHYIHWELRSTVETKTSHLVAYRTVAETLA